MFVSCSNGCCRLQINHYQPVFIPRSPKKKAGVFIFDPSEERVLIVLSRNRCWGLPKGSIKPGETDVQCAIREVYEETGIVVSEIDFKYSVNVNSSATYFYMEMSSVDVTVQTNSQQDANDVNGIGWIKLTCLAELVSRDKIKLNKQGKIAFQKIKSLLL